MKQKAFSIIEIIFALAIISIILVVAIPKMETLFTKSYKTQIQSTISLIREGIHKEKNKRLLANTLDTLHSLDDGDTNLFSKVLQTPIVEATEQKGNSWFRISTNSYKVFINDQEATIFTYDPNTYSFDCDYDKELCKELTQ